MLIQPVSGTNLSEIMQWIKTNSAKRWNFIHGSIDHLWGHRYFARVVKDYWDFDCLMNYIDQNPVKAGLAASPDEWKASGAYYKMRNRPDMVDRTPHDRCYTKLLPEVSGTV